MILDPAHAAVAVAIGLGAGLIGGLAGVGGSIVMLPALALVFGYTTPEKHEHHLYMASAMMVNALVALFSARKHAQSGAVDKGLRRVIAPTMVGGIVAGVLASGVLGGATSKYGLVVFLFCSAAWLIVSVLRELPDHEPGGERRGRRLLSVIGGGTGFVGGLLGVGGGIVLVPLLQFAARVPLKRAIATSAGVMWISSAVGMMVKMATLPALGQSVLDALSLGAFMGLGAFPGAKIGAGLTHRLPIGPLRIVIAAVLTASAVRMAGG